MTEAEWFNSTDPQTMLEFVTPQPYDTVRGYQVSDRKLRLFACACCRQVWDGMACGNCNECIGGTPGGCVCRIGGLDERSRAAVEVAERFTDGLVTREELHTVWMNLCFERDRPTEPSRLAAYCSTQEGPPSDWVPIWAGKRLAGIGVDNAVQAALLRDIIGNPWRRTSYYRVNSRLVRESPAGNIPDTVERAPWLTDTVIKLAQTIYDNRKFELMPILADALEEAGCTDAAILEHCRNAEIPCHNPECEDGRVACPRSRVDIMSINCGTCHGTGHVLAKHARGCWIVDLLLDKE